jgi:uncharacterized protein DUF3800
MGVRPWVRGDSATTYLTNHFVYSEDVAGFLPEVLVSQGEPVYMAFIQVAFDGSGTFNQHTSIAYAGCIATTRQWAALVEAWNNSLKREGLAYFKMAEAMTWYGEFKTKYHDWGAERDSRRNSLLNELADIARGYELRATGMWSDARVMATKISVPEKKVELFQGAILTLLSAVPDGNYATLMLDEELDIEQPMRAWIRQLRVARRDTPAPIVAVCFVDDRVFPAVQLADMIAWLYREFGEQIIASDGRNVSMNPLLDKLMHSSQFTLHKTEPGMLLNGLRKYEEPNQGR